MIHQLKAEEDHFKNVIAGLKTFEVRKNDRNFQVGDFLALNEIAKGQGYTGRCCLVKVPYILDDPDYVKDGYVILGIFPCAVSTIPSRYENMGADPYREVPVYGREQI